MFMRGDDVAMLALHCTTAMNPTTTQLACVPARVMVSNRICGSAFRFSATTDARRARAMSFGVIVAASSDGSRLRAG